MNDDNAPSERAPAHAAESAYRERAARRAAKRTADIRAAREVMTDGQLLAFLDAANAAPRHDSLPLTMLCNALASGRRLDDILYTDTESGFLLVVEPAGGHRFEVGLGYWADPLAAELRHWEVEFEGERVVNLRGGDLVWVS